MNSAGTNNNDQRTSSSGVSGFHNEFKEKCDAVFDLMIDHASTDRKWAA